MILRIRITHLILSLFLYTSLTAAWPWPPSLRDIEGLILRRQDNSKDASSSSASPKETGSASAGSQSPKPSKTAAPVSASGSKSGGKASASGSGAAATSGESAAASGSGAAASGTKTDAAQSTDVDPRLPPGGVNMVTPSPMQTTYYKIGDTVTFAWNYTSLSVTPSKIDVIVSCSANSATYTLASNASFDKTGSILWDTQPDETGTAPLLTETYTLIVHDAQKAVSAQAEAGHLGSYNQFMFGMYIPQSYTPRSDWTCAVCSAAISDTERQALKFMFGMCIVTVLSFTWFVGGFGGLI